MADETTPTAASPNPQPASSNVTIWDNFHKRYIQVGEEVAEGLLVAVTRYFKRNPSESESGAAVPPDTDSPSLESQSGSPAAGTPPMQPSSPQLPDES